MNAKVYDFEFSTELRQVEDVILSVFHTVLFYRTSGKVQFRQEGSYSVGTVGYEDVDCETVDFTYVRCMCPQLEEKMRRDVRDFVEAFGREVRSGRVSLQFYEKRKSRWPFGEDAAIWEMWRIKVDVVRAANEKERQENSERLSEKLAETVASVAAAVSRADYTPRVPNERDVGNVFETRYREVEPYLHRLVQQVGGEEASTMSGVTGVFKKIFREALTY